MHFKSAFGKTEGKNVLKGQQFPGLVDLDLLKTVKEFDTFDTHFTAKIHGFKDGMILPFSQCGQLDEGYSDSNPDHQCTE